MKRLVSVLFVILFSNIFAQIIPEEKTLISFTADLSSVSYGGLTTLRWNSVNAKYVKGDGFITNNQTSGSYYTGPLYTTTTFSVVAYGSNNDSAVASVTVYVNTAQLPEICIEGRPIGRGTNVFIPLYATSDDVLAGFKLTIKSDTDYFPSYAYFMTPSVLKWNFYSDNSDGTLNVAAVGDPYVPEKGQTIAVVCYHVNEFPAKSDYTYFSSFSFFDGKKYWAIGSSPSKIIDLPYEKYGDMDDNAVLDINDCIIKYQTLGQEPLNDTIAVKGDLNGDGANDDIDLYVLLRTVATGKKYGWLIFNNSFGYANYNSEPVRASWKKMTNGQWGLFSKEIVTNGQLTLKNSAKISGSNWLKQVNNKIYFVNQNYSTQSPIIISDSPIELTGTVNNKQQLTVKTSTTDVEDEKQIPSEYKLNQNYPNPFNPSTIISYSISATSKVNLKVYDMLGKEIATLVNEEKNEGVYEIQFNASNLPSGVYIYKLTAGNFSEVKKMTLMK